VLTGVAVEVFEPKGIGRCRMAVLADGSAGSLHPFVTGAVEPGAYGHHRRLDELPRSGRARLRARTAQPAGRPRPVTTPASCARSAG
jgi:hypothetical protein